MDRRYTKLIISIAAMNCFLFASGSYGILLFPQDARSLSLNNTTSATDSPLLQNNPATLSMRSHGMTYSYFYLPANIHFGGIQKLEKSKLGVIALKFSFLMDIIACLMIFVQFATGTLLVTEHNYSYSTPWIDAAYILLACVLGLICTNIWIKIKNYEILKNTSKINFRYKKLFCINQILILIFIALIIHDAVMKSTFIL